MFVRMFLISLFLLVNLSVNAEEFHPTPPNKMYWKFEGILGSFDKPAIQRGYQVYKEVCSACHSMGRIAFRNLQEIGFSEDEIKSISSSYQVKDGPNDAGEMFDRPARPSDYFIHPFPNKEAAKAANNGAVPPDLSLIIKARHNGPNYVYSLLTGYQTRQPDEHGLYSNPYFPMGGKLSMAPPLTDNLVQYTDNTQATVANMAHDVVNFLQWAAEPEMEERKKLGLKVITFLIILTILITIANKQVWSSLYKKKND